MAATAAAMIKEFDQLGVTPPKISRGEIIELFGEVGSGKSYRAMELVAVEQAQGRTTAWCDVDYALNLAYAVETGVDLDNLIICPGLTALTVALPELVEGGVNLIIVDSIERVSQPPDRDLLNLVLLAVKGLLNGRDCKVVFINAYPRKFGRNYVGSELMKKYANHRIEVKRGKLIPR